MPDVILGSDTNPGGRRYNEDRVEVQHVTNHSGLRLAMAVLADGVGGEARGERASQLAIDTFFTSLRQSEGTDILALMGTAVKEANLVVYAEARNLGQEGRMATTMVAAAVDPDNNLFITNAGDSRIYLCRGGKLVQLSRDHTFENVMVWQGKLTPAEAAVHPEAGKVMRVLGIRDELQVDVGVYESTTEYGAANRIGLEGTKLRPGDSVLLCSDGLVKHTPATDTELISPEGIARVLGSQEGEKAARAIMSTVLGRIPVGEQVDNISLAIMQIEDPTRAANLAEVRRQEALAEMGAQRRRMVLTGAVVGVPLGLALIVTLIGFGWFYTVVRQEAGATSTQLAQVALAALGDSQTVSAHTATPKPTDTPQPSVTPAPSTPLPPQPTIGSGEVAQLYDGETSLGLIQDDSTELIRVPPGESRYLAVTFLRGEPTGPVADRDGQVFLAGGSQVQLGLVTNKVFQLNLLPGTDLFAQTGPYPRGVELHLADTSLVVVAEGCMALSYVDAGSVAIDCYSGSCQYRTELGGSFLPVDEQTQLTLAVGQKTPSPAVKIPLPDHLRYWNLLNITAAGAADTAQCQVPNAAATLSARVVTAAAETQRADTPTPEATFGSAGTIPPDSPTPGPTDTETPVP